MSYYSSRRNSIQQSIHTDHSHVHSIRTSHSAASGVQTPQSRTQLCAAAASPIPSALVASAVPYTQPKRRKYVSSRLKADDFAEKPWTQVKNPRKKWDKIIFWGGCAAGLIAGAAICLLAFTSVGNYDYCLVLDDNFETLDHNTWNIEVQRGGFGTGSFEWTTADPSNLYTDAEGLHIVPTLTTATTNISLAELNDNYVLNLTTAGTCTANDTADCSIRSNKTAGTIINPVRSARINTKGHKSIKYGRVEVVAKMPTGDWLWPAIWMLPEANVYGPWPASGEIDIAEMKGNAGNTYPDGSNSIGSTLHWGPLPQVDAFYRTTGKHNLQRTFYNETYHTYGLEWNDKYMFMFIDTRLLQVFYLKFKGQNMWSRGGFGQQIVNHSALFDPWSQTGLPNTPFDQDFYLILNVAVGATNGFFPDGVGNKPWGDASLTAPASFWDAQSLWYPTWGAGPDRGMTVKSVKMWSLGGCGSTPPPKKKRWLF